jgi:hypothetical protein
MKNAALPQALPLGDRLVAASDEPGNNAVYEEYLRGFDEIPVLQDAVRIPPRRQPPPDFRRGERRDVRQAQRPDAYSVREASQAELELLYREYSQPAPAAAVRAKPKKTQKRKSNGRAKSKSASKKRSRA